MLCKIFQYGCEPVMTHRILIGFEAILEKMIFSNLYHCPEKIKLTLQYKLLLFNIKVQIYANIKINISAKLYFNACFD